MTPDFAIALTRHLLLQLVVLSLPVLLAACAVGLVTSVLQTLTGLQEQTLSTVPRLLVVFTVVLVSLPWSVHRVLAYTAALWTDLHRYTG